MIILRIRYGISQLRCRCVSKHLYPSKLQYDTDTGRTFPLYDREYFRKRLDDTFQEHLDIIRACLRNDWQEAAKQMSAHLEESKRQPSSLFLAVLLRNHSRYRQRSAFFITTLPFLSIHIRCRIHMMFRLMGFGQKAHTLYMFRERKHVARLALDSLISMSCEIF